MVLGRYEEKRKKRLRGAAALEDRSSVSSISDFVHNSEQNQREDTFIQQNVTNVDNIEKEHSYYSVSEIGAQSLQVDNLSGIPELTEQTTFPSSNLTSFPHTLNLQKDSNYNNKPQFDINTKRGKAIMEAFQNSKTKPSMIMEEARLSSSPEISPNVAAILEARKEVQADSFNSAPKDKTDNSISFLSKYKDEINMGQTNSFSKRKKGDKIDNNIKFNSFLSNKKNNLIVSENEKTLMKKDQDTSLNLSFSSASLINQTALKHILTSANKKSDNNDKSYQEIKDMIDNVIDEIEINQAKVDNNLLEQTNQNLNNEILQDNSFIHVTKREPSPWEITSEEERIISLSISKHKSESIENTKHDKELNELYKMKSFPVILNPPKAKISKEDDMRSERFSSSTNSSKQVSPIKSTNEKNVTLNKILNNSMQEDYSLSMSLQKNKKTPKQISEDILSKEDWAFNSNVGEDQGKEKKKYIVNKITKSSNKKKPVVETKIDSVKRKVQSHLNALSEDKVQILPSKKFLEDLKGFKKPILRSNTAEKSQVDIVKYELLQVVEQFCKEQEKLNDSSALADIEVFKGALELGLSEMAKQQNQYRTLNKELINVRKQQNELRSDLLSLRATSSKLSEGIQNSIKNHKHSQNEQKKIELCQDYVNELQKLSHLQDCENDNSIEPTVSPLIPYWINLNSDLVAIRQRMGLNPLPNELDADVDIDIDEIQNRISVDQLRLLNDQLEQMLSDEDD